MRALPGRRFTGHMVWYSQNSIPFTYRADGIRSFLPNHRYIEADDIWVWTEGFRDYLAARGARGRIHAVGPILWYLPDESAPGFERGAIVVFDVTPQTPAFTHKVGLTYNYYRAENVRAFVAGIIAARDALATAGGRTAPILLKHKRTHSVHHDAGYLKFIEDAGREGAIRIVETETNLYSLITGAAVVVVNSLAPTRAALGRAFSRADESE